jgi:hypothetical protein
MTEKRKIHRFIFKDLPSWKSSLPAEYELLIEQQILSFSPWYFLDVNLSKLRNEGLRERYPSRKLFAFAARSDCDDVACWENGKNNQVSVVHDFASAGFEARQTYETFWDWFRAAIDTMIEFGS